MLIYRAIPLIGYVFYSLLSYLNSSNSDTLEIYLSLNNSSTTIIIGAIYLFFYISIWIYPEKAKSILYKFSNKYPRVKGASKYYLPMFGSVART